MKLTAYTLILLPLLWIGLRVVINPKTDNGLNPNQHFEVTYDFSVNGNNQSYTVDTYLPVNTLRQTITQQPSSGQIWFNDENQKLTWKGIATGEEELSHSFLFDGKHLKFTIDPSIEYKPAFNTPFIEPTSLIQSDHTSIKTLAENLAPQSMSSVKDIARSFYDFVYQMPSNSTDELTDALTALNRYEASCNGKSRLLVSLFRAKDIPARMVGGIILEDIRKKTSHGWIEVKIGDQWVPFDPLNGHFAELPAHYLELHKGDNFLITRTKNIGFDYFYNIEAKRVNHYPVLSILNLWDVIDEAGLPKKPLTLLLILPIGAFLVSVFKNVVGLKTFGVFLPVLIAFAFMEIGIFTGLIYFSVIIVLIGLLNFPLEKWGILHTPKIGFMLTVVAVYCLIGMYIFFKTGWIDPSKALVFPTIILTMMAEKFARKVEEDSLKEALNTYTQTLIATLICAWVLSSELIQNLIITFPEALLVFAGLSLLLGKWIGLRFTEYSRFNALAGA